MSLRRILTLAIATLGFLAGGAHAQLRQGQEFTLLTPAQPTDGGGKVEVIEFFSYACGHCNRLEPFLESWAKKLPADVVFKRIPGAGSESWSQLALLFYSLEAMGKLDALHAKAFDAMHKDNLNLALPKVREQWMIKMGIDPAQYNAVEKSFTVQSKLARAKQLMGAYKVDGVPMLIVNGKYVTSTGHAGSPERVVPVVEELIAMARKDMGTSTAEAPKAAAKPAAVKK
ncbi:MAG TPA: thiol:disulfide interchange protein DsbA/DsbL [Usitatibacteraceae bacterium]|nr:thiol:disulfide interchange protein DsbA/DsbL [Usitatibacteraceae bacterium]